VFQYVDIRNISGYRNLNQFIEKGVIPDTGVHEPRFISASHTDSDADFAIGAFEEALKEVIG
jgi:glutamate-1-semialdehyde aminotransferase